MMKPFTRAELDRALQGLSYRVAEDEQLAPYTTLRIGGPCPYMIFPKDEEALARAAAFLRERSVPWRVLGGGTNLLVHDEGIEDVVLNVRELEETLCARDTRPEASAGWRMSKLAHTFAEKNLTGFEFAVGIPGSLGGAVCMNAGAFGRETKDVVESVYTLGREGSPHWLERGECDFGYRTSRFRRSREVVLRARFSLERGEREAVLATMREHQENRNRTQPVASQCAGCIFQNPPGDSAGRIIDALGLKGRRVGGASVSALHANYIISDGATAQDILSLVETIKCTVREKQGVVLQEEIVVW
jgi:UDP-N-acetylmuramate dehydrogenase